MIADYWKLGEDVQDRIRAGGYESESVEGIAVDLHDILQAADALRDDTGPAILTAADAELAGRLHEMRRHLQHIRWHTLAAEQHLIHALAILEPAHEQPL